MATTIVQHTQLAFTWEPQLYNIHNWRSHGNHNCTTYTTGVHMGTTTVQHTQQALHMGTTTVQHTQWGLHMGTTIVQHTCVLPIYT